MSRVEIPAPADVVLDPSGNVVVGRSVALRLAGTATSAWHYSALTGGTSQQAGLITWTDGTIRDSSGNKRYVDSGIPLDVTIAGVTRRVEPQGTVGDVVLNAKKFGARCDGVQVTDAAITAGTATLTSASAAFTSADAGKTIAVYGAGAQIQGMVGVGDILLTTILSVAGGVATLATNAGMTVTAAVARFGTDDTAALQAAFTEAGLLGADVFVPAGRYFFTGSAAVHFTLSSNTTIRGVKGKSILDFSGRSQWTFGSNDAQFLAQGTVGTASLLTEDLKRPPRLPLDVTSITRAGSTATVTTKAPHGLATGEYALIRGGGGSATSGQEAFYTETNNGVAADPVMITSTGASTLTYSIVPRQKNLTGVASTDILTAIGHGYILNSQVQFTGLAGGAALSNATTYYARDVTTNTFKVAASPGGAAIDFTTDITAGTVAGVIDASLTGAAHVDPRGRHAVIASTSGYRAGDMVMVYSDAFRQDEGSEIIDLGECNVVERVLNSTTLMLSKAARDDYLMTDNASIQKITPVENVHLEGLTIVGKGTNLSATNSGDKGIRFDYYRNCTVKDCEFRDIDLVVCEYRTGLGWAFEDNDVAFDEFNLAGRVSGHAYVQYGCSFANGAEDGTVSGNTFRGGRHHVVQSSSSARPGISRNVVVDDNRFIDSWLGAVSTHQGYDSGTITNNFFDGCMSGITVRYAEGTTIANNTIWGSEFAIQIAKHWDGAQVRNNIIRRCWTAISLATQIDAAQSQGEIDVTGNRIRDCETGIELHASIAGTVMQGIRVDGNRLKTISYVAISVIGGSSTGKAVTGVAATDIFTSAAHGYSNGDVVIFSALTGGTGLALGTTYFVINKATDTFQLATTPSGSAVDFTTDLSAGTIQKDYFSGSISHNIVNDCGQVTAGNAIRATNPRYVLFEGNRIESWSGMTRGIFVDGAGAIGSIEQNNTILGATTAKVAFTTGQAHVSQRGGKQSLTLTRGVLTPIFANDRNFIQTDTETGKAATGVAATDVITVTSHGWVNTQPVIFTAINGGAGLSTNTTYFVRDVSGDTFKLAATSGGVAIDFTTDIIATSTLAASSVDTITATGMEDGSLVFLRTGTASRRVTIRDAGVSGGNIQTHGGTLVDLNSTRDRWMAQWDAVLGEWIGFPVADV